MSKFKYLLIIALLIIIVAFNVNRTFDAGNIKRRGLENRMKIDSLKTVVQSVYDDVQILKCDVDTLKHKYK